MKFNKILMSLPVVMILTLTACNPTTPSEDSSSNSSSDIIDLGDGSQENPFKLTSKQDLIDLQAEVNADDFNGYVMDITKAPYFELTTNIDLGGMEWAPIGGKLNEKASNLFSANINGNGHTISNFKITETDSEISSYGLFGNFHGSITNLNVKDFNIDISPANVYTNTFVGGVAGFANIASFENVDVEGSIKVRYNKQNVDFYIGGLNGFNATYATQYGEKRIANVTNTRFITSNVSIDSNVANTFAGGITGFVSTTSGEGVINNAYLVSQGRIVSPNITGGIAGYLDKYSTISYAIVNGNVEGGPQVGGIVAVAASDSAITNSIVASKKIIAASLNQSFEYEGGLVAGLFTPVDEPENLQVSTLMYKNYASNLTSLYVGAQKHDDPHNINKATVAQLIDKTFLENNLGFDETEWTFATDKYPTLKDFAKIDQKSQVKVIFNSNMDGVNKTDATVSKYTFANFDTFVNKDGYTFQGWHYDEECKYDYRFYLPLYHNQTLYGAWENYADFAGMYVATKNNAGILDFKNNGEMNIYYGDYTYIKGTYSYYGDYIIFGSKDSYDWDNTYAAYDKVNHTLKFKASDNNATEFTYVPANELIGFYRNGKISIDFVSDNAGTITIPNGYKVEEIAFKYELSNNSIKVTSKDGKLTNITKLADGTISFTYDGVTYDNNIKIPFIANNESGSWLGKTYRGPELNNVLGVKDVTFENDGTVTFRHSYQRLSASYEYLYLDPDLNTKPNEYWGIKERTDNDGNLAFIDAFVLALNKDKKTYSFLEVTFPVVNGKLGEETTTVHSLKINKMNNPDGTFMFTGEGNPFGPSTTNIYEIFVDTNPDDPYMSVNQFSTYKHSGGYYAHGNEVIIKGDGSDQSMQTVLKYNKENDYFTTYIKATVSDPMNPEQIITSEHYYMLAPYEILGVFEIKGVETLKGQVYAYEGHTYYLDENGNVSDVKINAGSFNHFGEVSLTINGSTFKFNVINLYKDNILTLVK